jgi:hypothetical protein
VRLLPIMRMTGGINARPETLTFVQIAEALVDDGHFRYLNQWTWTLSWDGYPKRRTRAEGTIFLHQEVARRAGFPASEQTDHRDGNKLNAQVRNLRPATKSQNGANTRVRGGSTTGLKGVSFHKQSGKYTAQIRTLGKLTYLGLFDDPREAAKAYDAEAIIRHGPFALTNKSLGLIP